MRRMVWRYDSGAAETRDGLDARWWPFLQNALPGMPCVPLPNAPEQVKLLLASMSFSGFILTGGDDWGMFPERDETEALICDFAHKSRLPILGVCRGAQVIHLLHGGVLTEVENHVGNGHRVSWLDGTERVVNSWHKLALASCPPDLIPIARDPSGYVEAYRSTDGLTGGILWHPERESVPDPLDVQLFADMFGRSK